MVSNSRSCGFSWTVNHTDKRRPASLELDHRTDHLALVHQVEGLVDLIQRQYLADHLVDLDVAGEIAIDVARQLRAPLDAAECRAAPHSSGDQHERTRRDFLAGTCDADDGRFTPAFVAAFER